MTTYRAVVLTRPGDLDVLEDRELPLQAAGPGQVRLQVHATGAGATDLTIRAGRYRFAPPMPFVPGYEVVGVIDALGPGVTGWACGDRVAALTVHGGYAERLVLPAAELVRVPAGVDDGDAVALVLNYGTAYQALHRVARLTAGQTALVTGASGGVGSALLELLRRHGVRAIGAASPARHGFVRELGATPVDSRGDDLVRAVRAIAPGGVDAAFDGLGGRFTGACVAATRRRGTVVGYGFSAAVGADGAPGRWALVHAVSQLFLRAPLTGRRGRFYGISLRYRRDPQPLRDDLAILFDLLARGELRPRIAARLPLLAARAAQARLARGGVEGKIVHLAALPAPAGGRP